MNKEPTIYVIDPFVGVSGRTNLYASIPLREPGADWAKDRDEKRFYVTLPGSGKVAVIGTENFKIEAEADAGENPTRVAVQPDGQLVWVGNNGKGGGEGGVTAIDTATRKAVATIPTGKGHHELAFSPDSRFAYATNRGSGTVSVIDVRERKKVKDVPVGRQPISLDYSPIAGALYVADGEGGTVSVVDGKSHEVTATIPLKPGLGPMRFTPDGRWGLILNSREDAVHILDASTNREAHTVAVGKEPFQMVFSRAFAHVRCLGSERVYMVNLVELGKEKPPPVTSYPVGAEPPNAAPDLGLARELSNATGESEVLVVNPVSKTTHFYMEGMNAPSGTYKSFGQNPRAVETANRSLRETEPGVYATRVRFPVAGVYDVAFFLDSPKIVQCFSATAGTNPALRKAGSGYEIEYLVKDRTVPAGDNVAVRFRLTDALTGWGKAGLADVTVISFRAPSSDRRQTVARDAGDGEYEAILPVPSPGAYYVYVTVPSLKIGVRDFVHLSLMAKGKEAAPPGAVPGEKGTKEPK
jgi:YVTN family beta-propeller protein